MDIDPATGVSIVMGFFGLAISGVAALGACGAGLYAFLITPYRIKEAEKRLSEGDSKFEKLEDNDNAHFVSLGKLETTVNNMAGDIHTVKEILQKINEKTQRHDA